MKDIRFSSICLSSLSIVSFVFKEVMFPSLSTGIAGFSFVMCNTVLILNVQVLYKEDLSPGTAIGKTPEMLRVKQTQDHISSVKMPTVDSLSIFSACL